MEDGINSKKNQMEEDLNGKYPQWKTISMQDNLNGRRLQWKMTSSMEDDCNGRQPQMAYLDNFVLSLAQLSPSLSHLKRVSNWSCSTV